MSRPHLSILIVNWNTRDLVLRCLDSLAAATEGIRSEVIVVENGSVDGSPDALARRTDIVLLENDRNLGYAAAVNQAYERSSGELVLLLNSDVDLSRQALQSMLAFLDDHPTIAGVAPLYVFPDGSPQPFHFRFPTFSVTLANCSAIARRLIPGISRRLREYRMLDDDFSHARPVPQPSASCLLLRRSVLPDDHIFDERYPIFFNDVQLARSLAARGLSSLGNARGHGRPRRGRLDANARGHREAAVPWLDHPDALRDRIALESVAVSRRGLCATRSAVGARSTKHHRREAAVDGPFGRCRVTPNRTH